MTDITPVGFLDDKPVFACTVETDNMDVMNYTSGKLFALIGRIAGEQFDVIGGRINCCAGREIIAIVAAAVGDVVSGQRSGRACEPCG